MITKNKSIRVDRNFKNLLPKDGECYLLLNLWTEKESMALVSALKKDCHWKHESIRIFGKDRMQPRLTAFHGDVDLSYRYSGRTMTPKAWTSSLLKIQERILPYTSIKPTSVLLNWYRNGKDSMGWHRDNEPELGAEPEILSVSFGEPRRFLMRHVRERGLKIEIELPSASLLIMRGDSQKFWEHSIPKMLRVQAERINLTFRKVHINP